MDYLEIALFPVIWGMRHVLEVGFRLTGSYGVAIFMLSILVSVTTYPIAKAGEKIQKADADLRARMQPAITEAKSTLKGEARFNAIERIYREHGYHPIHSLKSVAGLAPQIPFLLSALLLLWEHPPLAGTSFLFITDLGQQDGLIPVPITILGSAVNLLPFVMTGLSMTETVLVSKRTKTGNFNAWILNAVLFFLVYSLPAAVVLYWTTNNFLSLTRYLFRHRAGGSHDAQKA